MDGPEQGEDTGISVQKSPSVDRSQLVVLVYKDPDTLGAGLSHDHVVRAKGWTGTVTWDLADAGACDVRFTVPVARLDVDLPRLRAQYGLEGELSESQREDVKKNLTAKSQLDAASHPEITFRSRRCSGTTGSVTVTGDLTLHGTSSTVSVPMKVEVDGEQFSASGSFQARHTDFGIEPFSAMLGQLKNKNEMSFRIQVSGTSRP